MGTEPRRPPRVHTPHLYLLSSGLSPPLLAPSLGVHVAPPCGTGPLGTQLSGVTPCPSPIHMFVGPGDMVSGLLSQLCVGRRGRRYVCVLSIR